MKEKKEYDMTMQARGMTGLALRTVIAGYLIYLATGVLHGALGGGSPVPEWAAWLIFLAFAAAAVGFVVFAWREYRKVLKAAELPAGSAPDGGENGGLV